MNPSNGNDDLVYKDAVFISVHKFVGGPQTPGNTFEIIKMKYKVL